MRYYKRLHQKTAKWLSWLLVLLLASGGLLPSAVKAEEASDTPETMTVSEISEVSETGGETGASEESQVSEAEGEAESKENSETAEVSQEAETSGSLEGGDVSEEDKALEAENEAEVSLVRGNPAEGFTCFFNPDKTTGVAAGKQGGYPIFALDDMSPKSNAIEYEGVTYYTVQGKNNPKAEGNTNPNGKVPATGAAMKVVAPEDGTISCFGKNGSGKTFYVCEYDPLTGTEKTLVNDNTVTSDPVTTAVVKDREYWFYAQGSKYQFAGFVFELPKTEVTIPLSINGAELLGDAVLTFTNTSLGTASEYGADADALRLTSGYVYSISVSDPQLNLDKEELDLTGTLPEAFEITLSSAPAHEVSGALRGLPEGASVSELYFVNEQGHKTACQVDGRTYRVNLFNGTYTAEAVLSSADGFEVYDHVAAAGSAGEPISNDVWFYGPDQAYPAGYRNELYVGSGRDYETIGEALKAVRAMNREAGQRVSLILTDPLYQEQVLIDVPDLTLKAEAGISPVISWYYGIGYKYYSIDESGYYNEKYANDRFGKNYAQRWGAAVRLLPGASAFLAEGITFENSFNRRVTERELADGVEVGSPEEYGQSFSGSLAERRSTAQDVGTKANVERAAALACDADAAEFFECTFLGSQDTLYTGSGRQYYRDCTISGQTDFIFGNAGTSCIFDNCELIWCGYSDQSKAGYITASRGTYLFRGSSIKTAEGRVSEAGYFGRPWGNTAAVTFLGTALAEDAVAADGWASMGGVSPEEAAFKEFGSYILNPADESARSAYFYSNFALSDKAFRLSLAEASEKADPANDSAYLGDWVPFHHQTSPFSLEGLEDWNTDEVEKVWRFSQFGTSTGADRNQIAEGSDIKGTVTLISCTFDPESGDILKKGGKYVADSPADGQSLYYTEINPAEENFVLQADVHIDYMNPTPDGQEGFALLLRDSLKGSGSYFSNLISVGGTKLPSDGMNGISDVKDLVGVRHYRGISDPEDASKNNVEAFRMGFDIERSRVEAGKTYRLRLEKTSYAYISRMIDPQNSDIIGEYIYYIPAADPEAQTVSSYAELKDPAAVQESQKAYVGLSAARGINATFSNIIFETSPFNAADWIPQPVSLIDPVYAITSPKTSAVPAYELVFESNADGKAAVWQDGSLIEDEIPVTAGEKLRKMLTLNAPLTELKVTFKPDENFKPGPYQALSDSSEQSLVQQVLLRTFGEVIYVKQDGTPEAFGTSYEDAVDLKTALAFVGAGQKVLIYPGLYDLSGESLKVERGRNGSASEGIVVEADPAIGGYVILDFGGSGGGLEHWGDYWTYRKIAVTRTANGRKGMQLAGHHNTLEQMLFYNNGTTGLQVSGTSRESYAEWPSYNTIKNCSAMNNADAAVEDADGFGAKLTIGPGNVFDGCIAAYNADDGWDLFAKAATGSVGPVTIRNSLTYRNGYVLVDPSATVPAVNLETCWDKPGAVPVNDGPLNLVFPEFRVNDDGSLETVGEIGKDVRVVRAGNGNGFKMGGTNLPGGHEISNSIAYENKAKGFDSNSCPDIKIKDSTSYNNGNYNIALYTQNKSAVTAFEADGMISFRRPDGVFGNIEDRIKLQSQGTADVYGPSNYYWDSSAEKSLSSTGEEVTETMFISLDTSITPGRRADGGIDMHGLLLLNETGRALGVGAQGRAWGQHEEEKAAIWAVGDSLLSSFKDSYYLPRQGYAGVLDEYFNAEVYNLAKSGTSSKSYAAGEAYQTLLNGDLNTPALGDLEPSGAAKGFLFIGFGHNDQKTEEARFTDPRGSLHTEGSFAHSLYTNYVKPALERGVTPVLITPAVRLTDDNTEESYLSASGHITEDQTVGGRLYPGGDYAEAIRGLWADCKDEGVLLIDLCEASKNDHIALGDEAKMLHAYTGQVFVKNEAGQYIDEEGQPIEPWDYEADYERTKKEPSGLDKTHTNLYGAKRNAWLIASMAEETSLSPYIKNKPCPEASDELLPAVNPDYRIKNYQAPETESALWPVYTDADGRTWYGTVFGDVGGQGNISNDYFNAEVCEDQSLTLEVTGNKGKIASKSDAYFFYYTKLPAGTIFELEADALIETLAANNQVSFGLMARDDLYIDTYISETMGDYVSAGSKNQGAYAAFGRKDGKIKNGPEASVIYGEGDRLSLKLSGSTDGFSMTYGSNPTVSAGFDYALTAVDPDSIYVGFYVTRNAKVNFSNISLKTKAESEPEPDLAEQFPPEFREVSLNENETLSPEDFVKNASELPEGTVISFAEGEAADTSEAGTYTIRLRLVYPDQSSVEKSLNYTVKAEEQSGESTPDEGSGTSESSEPTAPSESESSETETPSESEEPSETKTPSESEEPSETKTPSESEEPSETKTPSESEEPSETKLPSESEEPSETETPSESEAPSETKTPSESEAPSETKLPSESEVPSETETPSESEAPSETEMPSESAEPTETKAPSESEAPSETERPSESAEPSETEMPSESEEPSETETPSESAEPSETKVPGGETPVTEPGETQHESEIPEQAVIRYYPGDPIPEKAPEGYVRVSFDPTMIAYLRYNPEYQPGELVIFDVKEGTTWGEAKMLFRGLAIPEIISNDEGKKPMGWSPAIPADDEPVREIHFVALFADEAPAETTPTAGQPSESSGSGQNEVTKTGERSAAKPLAVLILMSAMLFTLSFILRKRKQDY